MSPALNVLAAAVVVGALAGVAWTVQVAGLRADVARADKAASTAEAKLAARIAAEATAVAEAVTKARAADRQALADQQGRFDELKKAQAAESADLRITRQRLLALAARSPARACGSDLPGAATIAAGAADASPDGLPAADGALVDGLLQLADEASAAARQRNFAVREYQVNCQGAADAR